MGNIINGENLWYYEFMNADCFYSNQIVDLSWILAKQIISSWLWNFEIWGMRNEEFDFVIVTLKGQVLRIWLILEEWGRLDNMDLQSASLKASKA